MTQNDRLCLRGSEVIEAKIKQLSEEIITLSKNYSFFHQICDESFKGNLIICTFMNQNQRGTFLFPSRGSLWVSQISVAN